MLWVLIISLYIKANINYQNINNMNDKDFDLKFDAYKNFCNLIGAAIGYGSQLECDIDDCYIDSKWSMSDDELTIIDNENEEYCFTISSYSAKGVDLFCGDINEYYAVMAYSERWEDTSVYILRKSNQVQD